MSRTRSVATRTSALVFTGIGLLTLAARTCAGSMRGPDNPLVQAGAYAPDFNLPRLTITSDPNGKPVGVIRLTDTVRLSPFRGKRPVCLIMSSYT